VRPAGRTDARGTCRAPVTAERLTVTRLGPPFDVEVLMLQVPTRQQHLCILRLWRRICDVRILSVTVFLILSRRIYTLINTRWVGNTLWASASLLVYGGSRGGQKLYGRAVRSHRRG
jgi:hypothetical protein